VQALPSSQAVPFATDEQTQVFFEHATVLQGPQSGGSKAQEMACEERGMRKIRLQKRAIRSVIQGLLAVGLLATADKQAATVRVWLSIRCGRIRVFASEARESTGQKSVDSVSSRRAGLLLRRDARVKPVVARVPRAAAADAERDSAEQADEFLH
jgi:hypothetical protein